MANVQASSTTTVLCAIGRSSEDSSINPIAPLRVATAIPRNLGCTVRAQRIIAA
jgi:hypothetical protein